MSSAILVFIQIIKVLVILFKDIPYKLSKIQGIAFFTFNNLQICQELKVNEPCPLCKQMLSYEYLLPFKNKALFSKKQLLSDRERWEQKERILHHKLTELEMEIERLQMEIQKQKALMEQYENNQIFEKQVQQKKSEIIDIIKGREMHIQTIKSEINLTKHELAQVFANIQNTINSQLSDAKIFLFKRLKNGELRPDFQIFYKNRPYRVLSYSEKIKCMIEISSIIRYFSNISYPIFIDNLESVTHLNPPKTQIFTSSVRKGMPLQLYAK
ncbi:hypothetical protein DV713_16110 [Parageobacillus thermoglucosidasius]|nr:hypothetical protein DV713_16110 [Parageobacillus thermoglucosidasius]